MSTREGSLRLLVEKWFDLTAATPVRLTRFSGADAGQRRCVRVEAQSAAGAIAIFFFRHDGGAWSVFPPRTERLAMSTHSSTA